MKILITRNADTENFGGAETYVVELVTQLKKNQHDAIVATASPRLRDALDRINISNISAPWLKWQRWHGLYTPLVLALHGPWILRLVIWYLQTIKAQDIDIIHAMNRDDWIAATIAGKITSTPVVWTDHADMKHELVNVRGLKNLLGKSVLFWAKRADKIMVVSNAEKTAIENSISNLLDEKLTVIYNGVSEQEFTPVQKNDNTIVIGITARLRNQKGLRELIDAFKKLTPPANKQLELWLIGDGPDELNLRAQAEDPRIKFLGFKTNWLDYVSTCDIFAFPSYTEGFSLSLLEAAMLARPIVATNVGGNPEVIIDEETGLLISAKDVHQLAEALQLLLDDPEKAAQLGKRAQAAWKENFQFNEIVRSKIIPLYTSVLHDR